MILVFGGHGQLGTELATAARSRVALIALGRSDVDVTDDAAVVRVIDRWQPHLVINAAAYNQVDMAECEPDAADFVNGEGAGIVARACAAAGTPLLHVSTDFVFDGRKPAPYVETDPIAPLNAYGRSKAAGEAAVREACRDHVILRTAWLFGAHGHNVLKTILRLSGSLDVLRFVSDQYGSPTAASDLARAILTVANAIALHGAPWGTYHVAGAGRASRWELAQAIVDAQARFTGHRPRVEKIVSAEFAAAAARPANSVLDSSRFAAIFDFEMSDWRQAVDRAVAECFDERIAA